MSIEKRILVAEDGDEYFETFTRFVKGMHFIPARHGMEALELCQGETIHLIFLDMDFQRTPRHLLLGDHSAATHLCNGMPDRGWKYLADHQGMYILNALNENGFTQIPVILSHDFSSETQRFQKIKSLHPKIAYLSGTADLQQFYGLVRKLLIL